MIRPASSRTPMRWFVIAALTREQKVQILNNWQLDASRLEGSEGEGMMGEGAPMLHRVRIALAALKEQP